MKDVATYRVKIFTPNSFLVFRGKRIRTPAECRNVVENELNILKLQMRKDSLKYEVIPESGTVVEERKVFKNLKVEDNYKEVEIEELYDDNDSDLIMDKLLKNEKASKK